MYLFLCICLSVYTNSHWAGLAQFLIVYFILIPVTFLTITPYLCLSILISSLYLHLNLFRSHLVLLGLQLLILLFIIIYLYLFFHITS